MARPTLDEFDRRILDAMRIDSNRTGQELAGIIGLSAAACLRRLQRLRKIGAIEREVAIIAPAFQAQTTKLLVLLVIDRHNPKRIVELTDKLRKLDEVERIFMVTGEEDIAVILNCASMEAFTDFAFEHFHEAPVEGYQTLVVMREYPTRHHPG